jgi:hypothetical protein
MVLGCTLGSLPVLAAESSLIERARAAAVKASQEQAEAQEAVTQRAKELEQGTAALTAAEQSLAAVKSAASSAAAAAEAATGEAQALAKVQVDRATVAVAAVEASIAAAKATVEKTLAAKAAADKALAEKTAAADRAAQSVLSEQAYAAKIALRELHNEKSAADQELARKATALEQTRAALVAAEQAAAAAAQEQAAAERLLEEKAAVAKIAAQQISAETEAARKSALEEAAQKADAERRAAEQALAPKATAAKATAEAVQGAKTAAEKAAAEQASAAEAARQKQDALPAATRAAVEAEALAMGGLQTIDPSTWDYNKARHLLFRAGFAGPPDEVSRLQAMGVYAAVDYLVDYHKQPGWPDAFDPRPIERGRGYENYLDQNERNELNNERVNEERIQQAQFRQWWLRRMAETQRPLEEKLTLFWHDHFATGYEDKFYQTQILHQQNQMLRKYADKFDGLLRGIVHDPAMILYLDNQVNVKGRGNENLGREVLELFTLGRDQGYSEQDLRELSRALTGYTYVGHTNQFRFIGSAYDEGPKTILGRSGNFSADEAVDIILEHPSTARYVAKKLFEFFAHRQPSDELVNRLAHVLRTNSYDLAPMLKNLFLSEEFYSEQAMGSAIKSPVELMVGTIRVVGMKQVDYGFLDRALDAMGQTLYQPPNVGGWEEGRTWISANRILLRYNAVSDLVDRSQHDVAQTLEGKVASSADLVDHLAKACLVGELSDAQRQALVDFVGTLPPPAEWSQKREELNAKFRGLLALLMSTPEYQLN